MSFSTQREFFNVSFPNEDPRPPVRKRSDGAIMTYDFCTDGRAWALDSQKRSNYILDIVHKARFRKALMHPEGQFELSKDYLLTMDVDDLAEYVLSLQSEVKRKNETVKQLEETREALNQQLDSTRVVSDSQDQLQRQSAMLEHERNEFEQQMADLEEVIVSLKDRADRYDLLAKENELLRQQVQRQRIEAADKMRLVNAEAEASFNRMRADDCDRLEAELIMYKTQYDELRQQKRELKEQLRRLQGQQGKVAELKRLLAVEQAQREQVEEEMEHLLALYDKQSSENRQRISRSIEPGFTPEDSRLAIRSIEMEQRVVESCENCKTIEAELASVKDSLKKELAQVETRNQTLQVELENTRKEQGKLPLAGTESVDQQKLVQLMAQLQKYETDALTLEQTRDSLEAQLTAREGELTQLYSKLAVETTEIEQLTTEIIALQKQTDELKVQLDAKDAALLGSGGAADERKVQLDAKDALLSSGGAAPQIVETQKQPEESRKQPTDKTEQLNAAHEQVGQMEDSELAASKLEAGKVGETPETTTKQLTEKTEQLNAAQEQVGQMKDSELAASKLEVGRVVGTPETTTEVDDLKKAIDDLQREVALLSKQLADAQELAKQLQEGAGDEAEWMKSIANLKDKLETANEAAKAKDAEIQQLQKEVETVKARDVEGDISGMPDEVAEDKSELIGISRGEDAKVIAKKKCEEEIQVLQERLEKCRSYVEGDIEDTDKEGKEQAVAKVISKQKCAEELQALQEKLEECRSDDEAEIEDAFEEGRELVVDKVISKQKCAEEIQALQDRLEKCRSDVEDEIEDTIEEERELAVFKVISKPKCAEEIQALQEKLEECRSHVEDEEGSDFGELDAMEEEGSVGTVIADEIFEDRESADEIDGLEDTEICDSDGQRKKLSASKDSLSDIESIESSDGDKIRRIAYKIFRGGITVLIWSELDHLHHHICKAMLVRFSTVGHNMEAIDKAIGTCNVIVGAVNSMRNREMIGMVSSTTKVPIRNTLVLKEEIPIRNPPMLKHEIPTRVPVQQKSQKPKSARIAAGVPSEDQQVLSMFSKGVPAPGSTSVQRASAKKVKSRVLVDSQSCRTRPWGPSPKTPTETFVAATLADGSRLVSRQKWH